MNKIDLIQALKDSNNLSKSEADKVVTLFFDQMADALAQGGTGRNPGSLFLFC